MSVVFDFNASPNDVTPVSLIPLPVNVMRKEKEWIVECLLYVFFLLFSLHRYSFVSVVFDLSASPNDVAPMSPMVLPFDIEIKEKSELLMDVFCVSFFLSSQLRSSSVSVVFDFNASLNDVAPVSLMSFPVT